ncbi:unnamed protein product [Cylindrotheca closterium]|uniref:Uncharacterized protein n=1 Tax=Cylindrotheca closterium TaxID=2856 RepID=A0AAD2GCR8_9STRA|nr:unnamed protein product [Cylindrotheca closterium]
MDYSNYQLGMITIQQNNAAVSKLKDGKVIDAFHLLSKACQGAHAAKTEEDSNYDRSYRYTWLDCSRALARRMNGTRKFSDGSLPFLFLQFLWIEPPEGCYAVSEEKQTSVHVRGFIWVLWYNLAIVSILLGNPVEARGNHLLTQSLDLFRLVQSVVDPQPFSKHWLILKLSILNNEACVLSDLADSHQRLDRLIQMGLALGNMSHLLDPQDREQFVWTVKTMADDRYAAAA